MSEQSTWFDFRNKLIRWSRVSTKWFWEKVERKKKVWIERALPVIGGILLLSRCVLDTFAVSHHLKTRRCDCRVPPRPSSQAGVRAGSHPPGRQPSGQPGSSTWPPRPPRPWRVAAPLLPEAQTALCWLLEIAMVSTAASVRLLHRSPGAHRDMDSRACCPAGMPGSNARMPRLPTGWTYSVKSKGWIIQLFYSSRIFLCNA